MQTQRALVVGDAHLGEAESGVEEAFHRFVHQVPQPRDVLVINGDLFDFWFEYRSVISRRAFPTLSALAEARRRGVRLVMIGGNHDRWGGSFWERELGATFHPRAAELDLAGWRTHLAHGDGLADPLPGSRALQAIVHHRWTAQLFRLLHPDTGDWLVRRFARGVAMQTRDPPTLDRAAQLQDRYARGLLERRPDLNLVVLGHSHRAALVQVAERRWYLNPGAWMDGCRYAEITAAGPALQEFRA